jgi:hypothetical protein
MPTDRGFNAEEFLALLNLGVYDRSVREEIGKLSNEQAGEVALLMTQQLKERPK